MKLFGIQIGGGSKRLSNLQDAQANMAGEQQRAFESILPQYMRGLDFLSNYAGLGNFHPQGYGMQTGAPPPNPSLSAPLGGYYSPPPAAPRGWVWNQGTPPHSTSQAPPAPSNPFLVNYQKGKSSDGEGDMYGNGDPMGPNPYPGPQQQTSTAPANGMQPPTAPRMQPPQVSRQQQFIQGQGGDFNQQQSSRQNRQQIQGGVNMSQNPYQNNSKALTGGVNNQQLGIFNDPADALRNAQAQDQINQQLRMQQHQLQAALAGRGLEDSGILAGALQQLNQNALGQYGDFRRNLAINAGQEQARRVAEMMQALAPGMGMPMQAQQGYGTVSNQSLQQQQMQNQMLGGLGSGLGMLFGMGGAMGPNPYPLSGMMNSY